MNDLLLKIAEDHKDDVVTVVTIPGPGPGDEDWTPEMWSNPSWWAERREIVEASDGTS